MRWNELFEDEEIVRANLRSPTLARYGFKRDNPEGEWLKYQQERAAGRICSGAITAYFQKDLLISAKWLHNIPGARNENRRPGEGQFDRLLKRVEEHGFSLSPDEAGLMGVDYQGNAWIIEGNTRAAVAVHLGIQMIPFECKYYAGGEIIRGHFDPESVCIMADLNTNPRKQY